MLALMLRSRLRGLLLLGVLAPFAVTGIAGTGSVGSVTASVSDDVTLVGFEIEGEVGSVAVSEGSGVIIIETGLQATGAVGSVNVWGDIVPSQDASWSAISPDQDASWIDIAA